MPTLEDATSERSATESDEDRPIRTVAVMMPFGGNDARLQRFYKLHFERLRQNVEMIEQAGTEVGRERSNRPIDYQVKPFYTSVHSIPLEGLKAVVDADILIALISRHNANVIYDVGIRQVVKGDVILLVEGDPVDELPVYLAHQGYIPYETPEPTVVGKAIEALSEIDFPTLITTNFGDREMEIVGDPENGVDGILTSLVRARDGDFRKKLEEALKEIEFSTPSDAPEINQLYQEVDPSRIIGAWDAYFPYRVTRVKWGRGQPPQVRDRTAEPLRCADVRMRNRLGNRATRLRW